LNPPFQGGKGKGSSSANRRVVEEETIDFGAKPSTASVPTKMAVMSDCAEIIVDYVGFLRSDTCVTGGFVEVTVTGVRGWVDEENMSVYADVSVEGNVWIEPAHGNPLIKVLTKIFKAIDPLGEFPFNKANAVKVEAHQVGKPYKAEWPMVNGTDPDIFQPMNRRHYDDGAYSAYNLEVEMGSKIKNKQSSLTDRFDDLVLELFNLHSSGILLPGQRVSWNLWPTAPEGVEIEEWEGHAEKWFNSMNIKHEYPDGTKLSDRLITTYDGTEIDSEFDREGSLALLKEFLLDTMNSGPTAAAELANDPLIDFVMNYLGEKRTTDYLK